MDQNGRKRKRRRNRFRLSAVDRRRLLLMIVAAILIISVIASILSRCGNEESEGPEISAEDSVIGWETIPEEYIVPANKYDSAKFIQNGNFMTYEDENYTSEQGIDVSDHNETVDWKAVKDQGITFAYIRAGYRGYTEGGLIPDQLFDQNMRGALDNGIKVGVYFFSQAINEEEAREEARFVLDKIKGYHLTLPIFYDPEFITSDNARTKDLDYAQFTANTIAFCDTIRDAGYAPGIYCNKEWQDKVLDMSQFEDITTWFAGYSEKPQSQYHFEYWQYTHTAKIDGFPDGVTVDMNIQLIPKER